MVNKHLISHDKIRDLASTLFEENEDLQTILPDSNLPYLYGAQFVRFSDQIRKNKYYVPIHKIGNAMAPFIDINEAHIFQKWIQPLIG